MTAHVFARVTNRVNPHVSSLPQTCRDPAGAGRRRPGRARSEERWSPTQRLIRGFSGRSDASAGVSTVGLGACAWRMRARAVATLPGRWAGTGAPRPPSYPLTASRRAFAALNDGALEAAMATGSPVAGFLPRRAARLRMTNFPNPAMVTGSSRARASRMSAQVRIPDADAADAARCGLAMTMAVDDDFPENLDRAAAVCTVVWPRR